MARKGISAKTRFDVFKRDGFKCLYCGGTPPSALLHVDHIIPVVEGGGNDVENLATSCDRCNLGKGRRLLSSVPLAIGERAAEVAEREAQIVGYARAVQAKRDRIEREAWAVLSVLLPDVDLVEDDIFRSVCRFVDNLGVPEVVEAAGIAAGRVGYEPRRRFKYFCGVCWTKIRDRDDEDLTKPLSQGGRLHG